MEVFESIPLLGLCRGFNGFLYYVTVFKVIFNRKVNAGKFLLRRELSIGDI